MVSSLSRLLGSAVTFTDQEVRRSSAIRTNILTTQKRWWKRLCVLKNKKGHADGQLLLDLRIAQPFMQRDFSHVGLSLRGGVSPVVHDVAGKHWQQYHLPGNSQTAPAFHLGFCTFLAVTSVTNGNIPSVKTGFLLPSRLFWSLCAFFFLLFRSNFK